jgi:4-cresol dehydrogenase (hydroxylating) flavoprotein subunit
VPGKIDLFIELLGSEGCLDSTEAEKKYSVNTLNIERTLLGALCPQNASQIPQILAIAQVHKISLYPISCGRNWGYGSALPVLNSCVILDLSALNRILEFNSRLGYVVLEPGVTQQDLHEFMQARSLNFMVPTTGAGPQASILGNALEKGYGITPVEDHTLSLLSLKAYLPDGSLYESQLHEFGGFRSDAVFKWKIGPQIEGLFSQGNLGIVCQATIGLVPKSDNVTQFISFIEDESFEEAVISIRTLKTQLGSVAGGINIMNRRRLLAMVGDPKRWSLFNAASERLIREMAEEQSLPHWMILGGLYGPAEIVGAAKELVKTELNRISNKTLFLNRKKVDLLQKILKFIPFPKLKKMVRGLDDALQILEGVPGQVALPLAYLKNPMRPSGDDVAYSPDRDQCGLIWFSPLLPMDGNLARDFAAEVYRVCLYHEVEPLITLTAISERCFDSTIPILFNKHDPNEVAKAHRCQRALIQMAQDMGIFPYRLDISSMSELYAVHNGTSAKLWRAIKSAVDPQGLISPGRYEGL